MHHLEPTRRTPTNYSSFRENQTQEKERKKIPFPSFKEGSNHKPRTGDYFPTPETSPREKEDRSTQKLAQASLPRPPFPEKESELTIRSSRSESNEKSNSRKRHHEEEQKHSNHKKRRRLEGEREHRYSSDQIERKNQHRREPQTSTHRLPMKGEIYLKYIMEGIKLYEGRVHLSTCQRMRVGDRLDLKDNRAGWGIQCEITSKDVYSSFADMLREKGVLNLLPQLSEKSKYLNEEDLISEGIKIYNSFPGSQNVNRFGAVAIGVKFIRKI